MNFTTSHTVSWDSSSRPARHSIVGRGGCSVSCLIIFLSSYPGCLLDEGRGHHHLFLHRHHLLVEHHRQFDFILKHSKHVRGAVRLRICVKSDHPVCLADPRVDRASFDHSNNLPLNLLRSGQANSGGQVSQGEGDEGSGESADICSGLACHHLLDKSHVVVSCEELLVLGHHGAGVLWQGQILLVGLGLVAVDQETHQLIFLVCFKHDVRHSCCGAGHADLEEI